MSDLGKYFTIFMLSFIFTFFSVIAYNGIRHSNYIEAFKKECTSKGGFVYINKGGKGWSKPECRPEPNIEVNV